MQFAPDLVLRNIREFQEGHRLLEECIPEPMQEGTQYDFLKEGQRAYWMDGEQPLLEKLGDGSLSPPKASIIIIEVTHFKQDNKIFTRGKLDFATFWARLPRLFALGRSTYGRTGRLFKQGRGF